MEHIEMVERLHEKAGISYADAKDALERSGWDMLEALVILEQEGKISPLTASTTSADDNPSYEVVKATASKKDSAFHETMDKGWVQFKRIMKDLWTEGCDTCFVVRRRGQEIFSVQVIIAVILALFSWQMILAAIVVGLILECRYSFEKRIKGDFTEKTEPSDGKKDENNHE